MQNANMADVLTNSMACHPRATCHSASAATWRIHDFNIMIPELRVTLQGAATGRIQRHAIPEPRITLQNAATW